MLTLLSSGGWTTAAVPAMEPLSLIISCFLMSQTVCQVPRQCCWSDSANSQPPLEPLLWLLRERWLRRSPVLWPGRTVPVPVRARVPREQHGLHPRPGWGGGLHPPYQLHAGTPESEVSAGPLSVPGGQQVERNTVRVESRPGGEGEAGRHTWGQNYSA